MMLKIFTKLLRDGVFEFLHNNKYIEALIQKGFAPGLTGTFVHIANMLHVRNNTRCRHRSVTIALIDLQNVFVEVHHNLIKSVLEYHYIPDNVISIIKSLYSDFHITILTNSFSSDYIKIRKGVLENDCLARLYLTW